MRIMMTPPLDSLTTAGCMGVSGSATGHEATSTLLCVHVSVYSVHGG